MVAKKRKTKRMTLKLKYKIQKKVKEHHRKQRKEKKKHPEKFPKKRKDPGVPKVLPFYDKVIQEAEEVKEARERRREEAKRLRKEQKNVLLAKKRNIGNLDELLSTASERGEKFEAEQAVEGEHGILSDRSAKAYYREFKKVVEAADVVLEVVDARDPQGTRVPQMESVVTSSGKKLVLVLNKADLVPRENLEAWLKYLRREHPSVAFKSSTQLQGRHLAHIATKIGKSSVDMMQSSQCLGADVLMQLLKNYCRNKNLKTAIVVGVVGLPNVGKSSLINSLKRTKSCGVAATPGFTKSMQQVQLDSKIKLLDCPGIVLPGGDTSDASAALRNAVKVEQLDDPCKPVEAILARADKNQLKVFYQLPEFHDMNNFLALLAKRLGKLKKGGIPNRDSAARKVLHDWNSGLIKYYTQPPKVDKTEIGASLVTELGKEFDIDSIIAKESSMLKEIPALRDSKTMVVESLGPVVEMKEGQEESDTEDEESMDDDDDKNQESGSAVLSRDVCVNMETASERSSDNVSEKKPRWETPLEEFDASTMSLKKFQKKIQKKSRKENNRNVKHTEELTSLLENFSGLNEKDEDYNFDEYFKD